MMKDRYPDPQKFSLPPCSLSARCIQYFDEIEALRSLAALERSGAVGDVWDKDRAEQLQEHLFSCRTCQVAMATARTQRDQQHQAFQALLAEGERVVPSTTASILTALRNEPHPTFSTAADVLQDVAIPTFHPPVASKSHQPQRRRPFKNISAVIALVAAAVLVVASMQLFTHFAHQSATPPTSVASTTHDRSRSTKKPLQLSAKVHKTATWSSVVVTHPSEDGKNLIVENYDPVQKKAVPLVISSRAAAVDGVSHAGDNLVYHIYDSNAQQTIYTFLSGEQYYFNGRGLNAVWSTDDSAVFLATTDGSLWKVDMKNRAADPKKLTFTIRAESLAFCRYNFLYYIRDQGLYRIDLNNDQSQEEQVVTQADSSVFWIDPTSYNIYYVKKNLTAQQDIYLHQSDTSPDADYAVQSNGTPIGYAWDAPGKWSIMYVSWNQNTSGFDLKKTSSREALLSNIVSGQARALCTNAATDGAICDNSLALSPTGRQLLVGGINSARKYQLWSIDLDAKTRTLLSFPGDQAPVQMIGWDKLSAN